MNWLSWGIIRTSFRIRTHYLRVRGIIRTVVKFYYHTFCPSVVATVRMHSDVVLSSTGAPLMKIVIKDNRQFGRRLHENQPQCKKDCPVRRRQSWLYYSLRVAPSVKDERVYAIVAKSLLSYVTSVPNFWNVIFAKLFVK